jgi:hypothetical protein
VMCIWIPWREIFGHLLGIENGGAQNYIGGHFLMGDPHTKTLPFSFPAHFSFSNSSKEHAKNSCESILVMWRRKTR